MFLNKATYQIGLPTHTVETRLRSITPYDILNLFFPEKNNLSVDILTLLCLGTSQSAKNASVSKEVQLNSCSRFAPLSTRNYREDQRSLPPFNSADRSPPPRAGWCWDWFISPAGPCSIISSFKSVSAIQVHTRKTQPIMFVQVSNPSNPSSNILQFF